MDTAYDNKGRLVGQTQTVPSQVNGVATNLVQAVSYGYNGGDRLTSIVYPSGRKVGFNYAAGAAQPNSITLQANATARPITVLNSIAWQPFGPVRSWKWGGLASLPHARSFDDSGRLTRYPLGLHTRDVSYDSAGRISGYKHYLTSTGVATPTLDQSFGYDKNSQLTSINLSATSWVIDYDANGNRSSVTIGTNTRAYGTEVVAGTTTPKSNRLKTLSNPAVSLTHQATGQTLSDASGASYSYYRNGSIRLIMLPGRTQSVGFMYDANGQRLRKYTQNQVVDEASQIHFVYDQAGHLLGEYDKSGAALREYIWLDDVPVAMFTPGATASAAPVLYYIHTDHLNTPRAVVDTAGNLRWRWIADPFGTAVPETNPAGLGAFVQNLRFPGQYADSETGLFYNMARYYDPMIGRYVESDPIGLAGGINTYAYVGGNPISYVDPTGLDPWWSDPTLKRIPNDNARVTAWLCRAYKEGGEQGAWGYIISQRKVGNDRYDDNLAAADRFGDMMNGNYSGYPPFQSSDFNLGQVVNKVRRNVVNRGRGNGSQSPEFVGRWGAIGAFYSEQGMRWADWAAKNCPCR